MSDHAPTPRRCSTIDAPFAPRVTRRTGTARYAGEVAPGLAKGALVWRDDEGDWGAPIHNTPALLRAV